MKARFIQVVKHQVTLQKCWGYDQCPQDRSKCHRAELILLETADKEAAHKAVAIPPEGDPLLQHPKLQVCKWCGTPAPADERPSAGSHPTYDTASGHPEPGDLYWADWYNCKGGVCPYGWTNCDGRHLIAILPTGRIWDINSRASNCTMRNDTLHRCWVIEGTPPNVTVGKGGHTCAAGAGSIAVEGYHGFLQNGQFT